MKTSVLLAVACVGVVGTNQSLAEVLEYGTTESPHPGGTVEVNAGTEADGFRFAIDGAPLVFSGEGSFSLTEGATLTNAGGRVRYEVPVAAASGVTIANKENIVRSNTSLACLTKTEQLLFTNVEVENLIPVGGQNCGGVAGYTQPYHVERKAGWMRVQYEHHYDYVKCVVAEFYQRGADVYGKATMACYYK